MKRRYVIAPLLIGLLLCGSACQKSRQALSGSAGANATNSPGGARAGAASQSPRGQGRRHTPHRAG